MLLVLLGAGGCDDGRNPGPCEPGEARECECSFGRVGEQVCRFDSIYSACLCGDAADGGPDGGSILADGGLSADGGADAGAADGGDPTRIRYAARWLFTALDRMLITKSDLDRDICFQLVLVSPSSFSELPGVSLPPSWAVAFGHARRGAGSCDSFNGPADGGPPIRASSGSGTVSWTVPDGGFMPTEIDVDVRLFFISGPPWVPSEELLAAQDLALR